jgi:hypothetical protein
VRTPPLPLAWPPGPDTVWVQYEAAHGFDPTRLTDAVRVAAPFARLVFDRAGRVVAVERLPGPARELSPQGVVPIDPPSGALDAGFERSVLERAVALSAPPAPGSAIERDLRGFVGTWLVRNGVLAAELGAAHRPFYAWLGLPAPAPD